jgi:hypothetical protein
MARSLTNKNVSSQRTFLRSRTLQDQAERHIKTSQRQYNAARSALLSLRGPGEWETKLQVLKQEDVRGISERAMTIEEAEEYRRTRHMAGLAEQPLPLATFNPRLALGEGRRTLSWIWYSTSDGELQDDSPDVHASE